MYTQASQRTWNPRSLFWSAMEFLVSKLTSRHGKRIIFITSLYFHVVRIEQMKLDAIRKLNQVMKLAANEGALVLPTAIRGFVWRDPNLTNLSNELSEEHLSQSVPQERAVEISERVVDTMPKWLAYGPRKEMVDDVCDLIQNGDKLAQAA